MNATDFLKLKGITQQQLAKQLNCTRANVSVWFSGKASPSVDNVLRITNALNKLGADTCYNDVFNALWQSRQERKSGGK